MKFSITTSLDLGPGSRDEYGSFEFKSYLLVGPSLLNYDWDSIKTYRKGAPEGQNASIVSGDVAPLLHDLGRIMLKMAAVHQAIAVHFSTWAFVRPKSSLHPHRKTPVEILCVATPSIFSTRLQ